MYLKTNNFLVIDAIIVKEPIFCTHGRQSLEMERQVICHNLGLLEHYKYPPNFILVVIGLYSQVILKSFINKLYELT